MSMFKKVLGEVNSAVAEKNAAAKRIADEKLAAARNFDAEFQSIVVSVVMPAFQKFVKDAQENGFHARQEPFEDHEKIAQSVSFMPDKGMQFDPRTAQLVASFHVTARKDNRKFLLSSYYDQRAGAKTGIKVDEVKLSDITTENLEAALEKFLTNALKARAA